MEHLHFATGTKVISKIAGSTGTVTETNDDGVCVCWDGHPWSREWMLAKELAVIAEECDFCQKHGSGACYAMGGEGCV